MSLILEALRKSEAERRRGSAPDLLQAEAVAPARRSAKLSPWHWLAVGLAVLAIAWWLLREPALAPRQAPLPEPAPQARAPLPVAPPQPAPLPEVSKLVPAPEPARPVAAPLPAVALDQPMPLSALTAAERRSLPPLQLSMHVWNEDPGRRFAILDGRRVAEGDRIGDAVVAAITRDGVVLDWNGRKLALPLP